MVQHVRNYYSKLKKSFPSVRILITVLAKCKTLKGFDLKN